MDRSCEDEVREVLLRERTAKDLGQWEQMARSFAADSSVSISWFRGSGREFAEAARTRAAAGGTPSFHEIGAVSVEVRGDRALADASCTVHLRGVLVPAAVEAVEFDIASRARLLWRVQRVDGRWLIQRLDAIYLRDSVTPVDPGAAVPHSMVAAAAQHRPSYRFLSLLLAGRGHQIDPDLPGLDRPDLVDAVLAARAEWLDEAA